MPRNMGIYEKKICRNLLKGKYIELLDFRKMMTPKNHIDSIAQNECYRLMCI